MKTLLEGFKGRIEQPEARIRELENRTMEIIKSEGQTEKQLKKCEQNLKEMWGTKQPTHIYTVGQEGEKKEKVNHVC